MITTKKINIGISLTSKILRLVIVFYFAILLAQSIWWILSPSRTDFYMEKFDLDQADKSSSYIINRYPMGLITTPKEAARTRIIDQIKLTGVYASDPGHSIAFIEYGNKPIIVRQGKFIDGQAQVKSINPDGIVIVEDGVEATVNISSTSASGNGSAPNSTSSGMPTSIFGAGANPTAPQPYYNQSNEQGSTDDYREKRKKMMEEIMQKERGNYPDHNPGSSYSPGGSNSSYPPGSYPPGYPPENMNR